MIECYMTDVNGVTQTGREPQTRVLDQPRRPHAR